MLYGRLDELKSKAKHYNYQIRQMKKLLEGCDNPLNINEWQEYSPCTGFHDFEQENDLPYDQKYYAYLLYFRALLKEVEKEIKKEKLRIKEVQRNESLSRNKTNKKTS